MILAAAFPGEPETRLRSLISSYIAEAAAQEWPMMAKRAATLRITPLPLAEAVQLTLALPPSSQGQQTAQREIATALESALDARRQRIIVSQSEVNSVKWSCLFLQAACALIAIAMGHSPWGNDRPSGQKSFQEPHHSLVPIWGRWPQSAAAASLK